MTRERTQTAPAENPEKASEGMATACRRGLLHAAGAVGNPFDTAEGSAS